LHKSHQKNTRHLPMTGIFANRPKFADFLHSLFGGVPAFGT
jgi:hypothetical protein